MSIPVKLIGHFACNRLMRTSAKPLVHHRHLTTGPQLQQKGAKAVARHLRANLPGDGSVDNVEVAFSVAVTRTAELAMPIADTFNMSTSY